jgi:hypothetical protein
MLCDVSIEFNMGKPNMHIKMHYGLHGLTINVPGKVDVFTIRDVLPCDDEGGFGTFPLNGGWKGSNAHSLTKKRPFYRVVLLPPRGPWPRFWPLHLDGVERAFVVIVNQKTTLL